MIHKDKGKTTQQTTTPKQQEVPIFLPVRVRVRVRVKG
jgi:hypothetical protein